MPLAPALQRTIALESAHEQLGRADACVRQGDTLTAIQQAHDALETTLREVVSMAVSRGLCPPPSKPIGNLQFTDYMNMLGPDLIGRHWPDLWTVNKARIVAKHDSIPAHPDFVSRCISATRSFMRTLGLWPVLPEVVVERNLRTHEAELGVLFCARPVSRTEQARRAEQALLDVLHDSEGISGDELLDRAAWSNKTELLSARWRLTDAGFITYDAQHNVFVLGDNRKSPTATDAAGPFDTPARQS